LFLELDRPEMEDLPAEPINTPSGWCRVGLDYNVDIEPCLKRSHRRNRTAV
jgi:hypothetical protein